MANLFLQNINEHQQMVAQLSVLDEAVTAAIAMATAAVANGCKIMFCGNGGSAADSQHLAAEFTGRFIEDRKPLPAVALSTDTSALTCIGNDYSFAEVFSRQVYALGKPGDCLFGISTSGNSGNVIKSVHAARELGIKTIGLLGRDGGQLATLCDLAIIVPHKVTARIQEAHILIGHTICGGVEQKLGLVPATFEK